MEEMLNKAPYMHAQSHDQLQNLNQNQIQINDDFFHPGKIEQQSIEERSEDQESMSMSMQEDTRNLLQVG